MSERYRFKDKAIGAILATTLALSGVGAVAAIKNSSLRFEPKASFDPLNNSLSYGLLAGINVGNVFPNYLGVNLERTNFFGPKVLGVQEITVLALPGRGTVYYSQCSQTNLQDDNSQCLDSKFINKE